MKESIYTIPVTEAFALDCECPICILEKDTEDKSVEYFLGASLMEPDVRIETNKKGFCRRHYELMYNKRSNQLGLGLILDTHLAEKNKMLEKTYSVCEGILKTDARASLLKSMTNKASDAAVNKLISEIDAILNSCIICEKMNTTMDRFIDVIFYLYFRESDFQKLFHTKKGFCLKHLHLLLSEAKKYLNAKQLPTFVVNVMTMQLDNMNRIQQEVNWFTRKFDYKNRDEPWGNSKDALPRAIEKISGYCRFT